MPSIRDQVVDVHPENKNHRWDAVVASVERRRVCAIMRCCRDWLRARGQLSVTEPGGLRHVQGVVAGNVDAYRGAEGSWTGCGVADQSGFLHVQESADSA